MRAGKPVEVTPRNSRYRTIDDRLWSRCHRDGGDGCWVWQGAVNNKGYGTTTRPRTPGQKGRSGRVYAHRLAWEESSGPIPEGLVVDHICHNRRCINPLHLRLATPGQNLENRKGASANSKTGHLNVYPHPQCGYVVQVKHKHIGAFKTLEDAIRAAAAARSLLAPFASPDARLEGCHAAVQ
ncbi:HNH endonuclease [Arachnia propionica]|uniref:HNH endonuclease n=1 Tax=Arachnia propionica TaxID=1750 RepID=A0A3P1T1Q7_9ACTN|nr:HNH endonuclease signature motif containing protein [Arachnia propionica]RRD03205.1 HNH endonuclease [Arachnia propionica]